MDATALPSLLVVEDDDVDYRAITRALKKASLGVACARARNGEEALDILRQQAAARSPGVIVLLDLRMPIMDGHAFLKAIREDEQLKGVVVFVTTTSDDDRDVERAFGHQVAGYFLKQRLADYRGLTELLERYMGLGLVPPLAAA